MSENKNAQEDIKTVALRAFNGKAYFATFSSDKAVEFVDTEVYVVDDVRNHRIHETEVISKQIPAYTGVLLKSSVNTASYKIIDSAPAIGKNMLRASVNEGLTTAPDGTTDDYWFYKLGFNKQNEPSSLGFYFKNADGGPFVLKAGMAYLVVPKAGLVDSGNMQYNGNGYKESQEFVSFPEQKKFQYNAVKNFTVLKNVSFYDQDGQPTGDLVMVKF